jgi:hypothetical protein
MSIAIPEGPEWHIWGSGAVKHMKSGPATLASSGTVAVADLVAPLVAVAVAAVDEGRDSENALSASYRAPLAAHLPGVVHAWAN